MIMKFSTNARCAGCKAAILDKLNATFPDTRWDLDLETPEKVLTATGGHPDPAAVIEILAATGFRAIPL